MKEDASRVPETVSEKIRSSLPGVASPGRRTAFSLARLFPSDRPGIWSPIWMTWGSVTSMPPQFSKLARRRAMAMTSAITSSSTRPLAARKNLKLSAGPYTPRKWDSSWMWCPTTWASARTICGGWMCWRTAPAQRFPATSTLTFVRPNRSWRTILLPILEDQYGKVLESGKFRLAIEEGAFFIYYYDHKLPVAPLTYTKVLGYPTKILIGSLGKEIPSSDELQSILTALSHLPPTTELDPES